MPEFSLDLFAAVAALVEDADIGTVGGGQGLKLGPVAGNKLDDRKLPIVTRYPGESQDAVAPRRLAPRQGRKQRPAC